MVVREHRTRRGYPLRSEDRWSWIKWVCPYCTESAATCIDCLKRLDVNSFHCLCYGCLVRCRCDGSNVSYGRRRCHTGACRSLFSWVSFFFFFDRKLGFKNSFQTLFSNVVLCMDADRVLLIVFVLGARVSFGTRYWSERIVLFITRCGVVWISLLVIHTNGVGRRKRWTLRRSCGRWLMWIFGIRFMDSLPYTVDNLCYVFSEYDYVLVLVCLLSQEHVRRL